MKFRKNIHLFNPTSIASSTLMKNQRHITTHALLKHFDFISHYPLRLIFVASSNYYLSKYILIGDTLSELTV